MQNFWGFDVWGGFNVLSVLLITLLVANMLKKNIKFLHASLIPTSVLGGALLIVVVLYPTIQEAIRNRKQRGTELR